MAQQTRKRKGVASSKPPPLPDDNQDEDVELSDEDLDFFKTHKKYSSFLSKLDKGELDSAVGFKKPETQPKKPKRDDPEVEYENRANRSAEWEENERDGGLLVDPQDALPVKTLDGKIVYGRLPATGGEDDAPLSLEERRAAVRGKGHGEKKSDEQEAEAVEKQESLEGRGSKKIQKAERRKLKKEMRTMDAAAKQMNPDGENADWESSRQKDLTMVEKELEVEISVEERRANLRIHMADLGTNLLADPEAHLGSLKELQGMCRDSDQEIAALAALSLTAVFKDILPGYRIRLPTEKEVAMPVSKEVKKLRAYEATLLRDYQTFVQWLVKAAKAPSQRLLSLRCMGTLLAAAPHFNFYGSLLAALVPRMDSADDQISRICCDSLVEVFSEESKHGGEATVEAVQLIADLVRQRRCSLRPAVVEVFLKLRFDEDLGRASGSSQGKAGKHRKGKGAINSSGDAPPDVKNSTTLMSKRQRKAEKRRLSSKLHKQVTEDFRESLAVADASQRKRSQAAVLSAVFETYFRVLKTSLLPGSANVADGSGAADLGPHPLLAASLEGLSKFSHLISVEFMEDILEVLRQLARGGLSTLDSSSQGLDTDENYFHLTVEERLRCCIVAFRIVKSNMDALNVDLREFHVQLYAQLLEAPLVKSGVVLAEALQVMLWDGRQTDLQRCAAFIRRLAAASLHFESGEAMAVLFVVRHLLQRHSKCRNLLENDPGGSGVVSAGAAVFQSDGTDPDTSAALSSVLWELSLLCRHFHPAVSRLALGISKLADNSTAMLQPSMTPGAALSTYSTSHGGFRPGIEPPSTKSKVKGRRGLLDIRTPHLVALMEEGNGQLSNGMFDMKGLNGTADHGVIGDIKMGNGIKEDDMDDSMEEVFRRHYREGKYFRQNAKLRRELRRVTRERALMTIYLTTKKSTKGKKGQ